MTTTNMFLNFGGKWDSTPLIEYKPGVQSFLSCFFADKLITCTHYIRDVVNQPWVN